MFCRWKQAYAHTSLSVIMMCFALLLFVRVTISLVLLRFFSFLSPCFVKMQNEDAPLSVRGCKKEASA
jgi:hypothetical protein